MFCTRLSAPLPPDEPGATRSDHASWLGQAGMVYRSMSPSGSPAIPDVRSAAVCGRWRFQVGLIGVPASYRVLYRFGESMERRMRLYALRIPLARGLDVLEITANDARTVFAGRVLDSGPAVVPSAAMVMWIDALIFRSSAVLRPDVEWEQVSEACVRMSYPVQGRQDSVEIGFSRDGRRITGVSAMRMKSSRDSGPTGWNVDTRAWRVFDGVEYPSEFSVKWADMKRPWSRWLVEKVALNAGR